MGNSRYFIYATVLTVGFALVYGGYSLWQEKTIVADATETTEEVWESKVVGTTGMGDAAIELTPVAVTDDRMEIQISINTHSVDLSVFDLGEVVTLIAGETQINPSDYPQMDGHHVSGVMVFEVTKKPEPLKIVITDIPQLMEREYQW